MDITEIIRRAFIFPSKNLEILSIYAILLVLAAAFAVQGVITFLFGIIDIGNFAEREQHFDCIVTVTDGSEENSNIGMSGNFAVIKF